MIQIFMLKKIQKILDQTERVRHIIYFPSLEKTQTQQRPINKQLIEYIPLEELEKQGTTATIGNYEYETFLLHQFIVYHFLLDEHIVQKRPDAKDDAVIMYTSGSTGTPKGLIIMNGFTCFTRSKVS